MTFQKTHTSSDSRISNAAGAVNAFLSHLEEAGVGPELAQKLTIAATPTIIQATLYGYNSNQWSFTNA